MYVCIFNYLMVYDIMYGVIYKNILAGKPVHRRASFMGTWAASFLCFRLVLSFLTQPSRTQQVAPDSKYR